MDGEIGVSVRTNRTKWGCTYKLSLILFPQDQMD